MSRIKYIYIFVLAPILSFSQLTDSLIYSDITVDNLSVLNTRNHEFCPQFYENHIVYVGFNQSSKSDKPKKGETRFDLMISYDNEGELLPPISFSQVLNSKFIEGPFCFSQDQKSIYFSRTNMSGNKKVVSEDGSVKMKIYESFYVDSTWTEPKQLIFPTGDFNFFHPAINPTEDLIIFSSDIDGGFGKYDLYYSKKIGDNWSRPENLGPYINTKENDCYPMIINNDYLYFSTEGRSDEKNLDIYEAKIEGDIFLKPVKLPFPINTPSDDFGIAINQEMNHLLFSSNRQGKGKDDIFSMLFDYEIFEGILPSTSLLSIEIIDTDTKKELSNSVISLILIDRDKLEEEHPENTDILINLEEYTSSEFVLNSGLQSFQQFTVNTHDVYAIKVEKEGYKESRFIYDPQINSSDWTIGLIKEVKISVPSAVVEETSVPEILNNESVYIPTAVGEKIVFENIYYELDSYEIQSGAAKELDQLAEVMLQLPNMLVQLTAHTDARGDTNYNQYLSEQRAIAAKNYLIQQGVNKYKVITKGLGDKKVRNRCKKGIWCSEEEHRFNRRTEVTIIEN